MDLVKALEAAEAKAAQPDLKCKVCDFLADRTEDEKDAMRRADLRAKKGTLPKVIAIQALCDTGLDVGHSTYSRHLKHVEGDVA